MGSESAIPCSICESSYLDGIGITENKDVNTMEPRTPADRGNEIAVVGSDSPLTSSSASSPPLTVKVSDSDATEWTGSVPEIYTPRTHVFYSFAPGPEELALAPRKKPLGESSSQVARKLKFDSDSRCLEEGLGGDESRESFLEVMMDEMASKNSPLIEALSFHSWIFTGCER